MHTPPIMLRRSTMATRRPSLAAAIAARWPPGPDPSTRRSKSLTLPSLAVTGRAHKGLRGTNPCRADDAPVLLSFFRLAVVGHGYVMSMEMLGIDIGGSGIKGAPVDLDTGEFT